MRRMAWRSASTHIRCIIYNDAGRGARGHRGVPADVESAQFARESRIFGDEGRSGGIGIGEHALRARTSRASPQGEHERRALARGASQSGNDAGTRALGSRTCASVTFSRRTSCSYSDSRCAACVSTASFAALYSVAVVMRLVTIGGVLQHKRDHDQPTGDRCK